MPNDRDTHFLGFAELLTQELQKEFLLTTVVPSAIGAERLQKEIDDRTIQLIAQRAYDLAFHTLAHAPLAIAYEDKQLVHERLQALAFFTPDLTQWPD